MKRIIILLLLLFCSYAIAWVLYGSSDDQSLYVLTSIIFLGCAAFYYLHIRKQKRIESLRQIYHTALQGSNKRAALEAGRAYYAALRGNRLTIYDEAAISNDLNIMEHPRGNYNQTNILIQ